MNSVRCHGGEQKITKGNTDSSLLDLGTYLQTPRFTTGLWKLSRKFPRWFLSAICFMRADRSSFFFLLASSACFCKSLKPPSLPNKPPINQVYLNVIDLVATWSFPVKVHVSHNGQYSHFLKRIFGMLCLLSPQEDSTPAAFHQPNSAYNVMFISCKIKKHVDDSLRILPSPPPITGGGVAPALEFWDGSVMSTSGPSVDVLLLSSGTELFVSAPTNPFSKSPNCAK